jgi:hypothetical protein
MVQTIDLFKSKPPEAAMGIKEILADRMMGAMKPEEKQQMMDAMMEKFFSTLSAEDRRAMMDRMMEKFMSSMTSQEKQAMMMNMMPKMMGQMMGGGGMMGDRMSKHMAGMKGKMSAATGGAPEERKDGLPGGGMEAPWDMCRKMMARMGFAGGPESDSTPEINELFEEWAGQIEQEILEFIKPSGSIDLEKISAHFKLSKEAAASLLTRMAEKGKIAFQKEGGPKA